MKGPYSDIIDNGHQFYYGILDNVSLSQSRLGSKGPSYKVGYELLVVRSTPNNHSIEFDLTFL